MNKGKSIVLLGATFATGNMGVSALAAGSIRCLFDGAGENRFTLLNYGAERRTYHLVLGGKRISVELINMRFSKKFYLSNNVARLIVEACLLKLIPFAKTRRKLISRNFYLNHLYEADLVASVAGGDSFSDLYGLERFLYASLPQLLVLWMGQKLIQLPQTFGPYKGWLPRMLARYILKKSFLVYSRDYAGLEEMQDFLGREPDSARLRFCYDVGFVVEPYRPETMDLDGLHEEHIPRPLVGLNVSGLLWEYARARHFGLRIDYRLLINELISHLINTKRATVLLIPHEFGLGENSEADQAALEDIYPQLKKTYGEKIYFARGRYDQSEIKYIIGLCDFFVGSRMHACIAAISQHIPTVPVAYSKKFTGVMETVEMDKYVADPRTMDTEEILRVINRGWAESEAIRARLEQRMPEVRKRLLGLFGEIDRELGADETGR